MSSPATVNPQHGLQEAARTWGCICIAAALAVLMMPQSGLFERLGVPNSSCAGLGPLLMSWAGSSALGLAGGLLLIHPTSGVYAATGLGALSLVGFSATIVDGASLSNWNEVLIVACSIGLLPSAQLVLGLWLLRMRRRALAAAAG